MINTKGLLSEKIYMHTKIYQQFHKLQGSARDSNYLEESNLFAQLGSDLHQLVGSSWMWRLGGGVDRREHTWNQGVGFKFLHSTLFQHYSCSGLDQWMLFLVPVMNYLLRFHNIIYVEIGSQLLITWDNSWNTESTQKCWLVLGKEKTVKELSNVANPGGTIRNQEKPTNILWVLCAYRALDNFCMVHQHWQCLNGSSLTFYPKTSQMVSKMVLH